MSAYVKEAALPLVEPAHIKPIYADGLAEVVISNGRVTYVHYIEQPTYYGNGERVMERVVVAKITIPLAAYEEGRTISRKAWMCAQQTGMLSDGPPPSIGKTQGSA
ncbi:hypothetical protein SAMN05519103_00321 [Rhizobiales bacterium GAS113]|nr:hypothetical protein SAMN05519103_00321 [Rhizobiales bacterium GAS113]